MGGKGGGIGISPSKPTGARVFNPEKPTLSRTSIEVGLRHAAILLGLGLTSGGARDQHLQLRTGQDPFQLGPTALHGLRLERVGKFSPHSLRV